MNDKLSDHISLKEATFSQTATRLGIENTPNTEQMRNMAELSIHIFEPLRKALGGNPIHISSFFRSQKLNDAIGGAKNSQHMSGQAMDIDNELNPSNREIFNYIKNHMDFDQLINEYPDSNGNPSWVHVSWAGEKNRRQVL